MNRLHAGTIRQFAGSQIDREKTIRFRLDGRQYTAYAGDTILSALIASGVDSVGTHKGSPIGLGMRSAPSVRLAGSPANSHNDLSMSRTLVRNGLEFVTIGPRGAKGLARLFHPGRTLALALDDPGMLDERWRDQAPSTQTNSDLIVVGGGVAGMSAALAGANNGLSVTLIEASHHLGGHSGLFGTQDGEDSPDDNMAALASAVANAPAIEVIMGAQVFAVRRGKVRAHLTDQAERAPKSVISDYAAPRIVLATGSIERLPLFSGNRLPGVIGALEAYELANSYGVWSGTRTLFATASSVAYRLAMLARDADLTVDRILDTRAHPASRFIEFSKAYGIRQFPGTQLSHAEPVTRDAILAAHLSRDDRAVLTDRLIVCGGWQPDLTLWHAAGGASAWSDGRNRLEPAGTLDGIELAGSVAGIMTRRGCIESGARAVDHLLGRDRKAVDDPIIDAIYETPDGPERASADQGAPPTYLDWGSTLLERPGPVQQGRLRRFLRSATTGLDALSASPQPLTIGEVAAGVDLGIIPEVSAGIVAAERVALVPLADSREHAASTREPEIAPVPPYLVGRFPEAQVVRVHPDEARTLDTGALIYRNADEHHPMMAIGVVIRQHGPSALALVAGDAPQKVVVRDGGREIASRISHES